jgi:PIN domain nuclease of toxin-antitoxin system
MILLDTQTLFWYLTGDAKLGPQAKQKLKASQSLYFSSLSILELEAKFFDQGVLRQRVLRSAALDAGLRELSPTGAELERVGDFPQLVKHDPLDRALMCQASWHNATFYTSDRKLLSMGLNWVRDSQN